MILGIESTAHTFGIGIVDENIKCTYCNRAIIKGNLVLEALKNIY